MLPKITHPTAATPLPSTGKSVRFRPMQAREEKLLLHAKESEDRDEILTVVSQVVQNCVQDVHFKVDEATLYDVEWLFIRIRMQSVSPVAEVSYIDRSDKKQYDFAIDLDKVEMTKPTAASSVKVNDDVVIELRHPSVADYLRASELKDPEAVAEELALSSIYKVYSGDEVVDAQKEPRQELQDFIDSLDLDSYHKITAFLDDTPRLSYTIRYQNSKGEDRLIALSKLTDFFAFA